MKEHDHHRCKSTRSRRAGDKSFIAIASSYALLGTRCPLHYTSTEWTNCLGAVTLHAMHPPFALPVPTLLLEEQHPHSAEATCTFAHQAKTQESPGSYFPCVSAFLLAEG
mmetsp:Transcript_707/g.4531  ORF Transcript_707/g.4531 Transcript_707/m.4531 type:complete len:110 (+) Transcript_707:2659-2988(+)